MVCIQGRSQDFENGGAKSEERRGAKTGSHAHYFIYLCVDSRAISSEFGKSGMTFLESSSMTPSGMSGWMRAATPTNFAN